MKYYTKTPTGRYEKPSYLHYRDKIVDRLLKNQKAYNGSFNDLVGNVLSELEEIVGGE